MRDRELGHDHKTILERLYEDLNRYETSEYYPNMTSVPTMLLFIHLRALNQETMEEVVATAGYLENWLAMSFGLIEADWDTFNSRYVGPALTPQPKKSFLNYAKEQAQVIADRDGGWFCHYCHAPVSVTPVNGERHAHRDHKVAKSLGGSNDLDNLVLACAPCNIRKGNRYTYEEFYAMTAELRSAAALEDQEE